VARRLEAVIDSSVAVEWFSEEEATPAALELRDSHVSGHAALITNPLLACELANALRYKPDYNKDRLVEAMNHLYKLHLYEVPIDAHLLSLSSEIAFRGNVTIYDAIPVALAAVKKIKCITADNVGLELSVKLSVGQRPCLLCASGQCGGEAPTSKQDMLPRPRQERSARDSSRRPWQCKAYYVAASSFETSCLQ